MSGIVVWDGRREGPGGALLGDYEVRGEVRPRQWLVLPPSVDTMPAPTPVPAAPKPPPKPRPPAAHAGPVCHARNAIWTMLRTPVTVNQIAAALHLPRRALATAISQLFQGGAVIRVPGKSRDGGGRSTTRYQRSERYATVAAWPWVPRRPWRRPGRPRKRAHRGAGVR
jgi:hypothetical protein